MTNVPGATQRQVCKHTERRTVPIIWLVTYVSLGFSLRLVTVFLEMKTSVVVGLLISHSLYVAALSLNV